MVTIYNIKNSILKEQQPLLFELRGLSTDDKPTIIEDNPVDNGSSFIEIDTGKLYLYNLDGKTWEEI